MKFCYKKNILKFFLFLTLILVTCQISLHAQNTDISTQSILKKSISTQKSGMIVLGSWATLNIISGSVGFFSSSESVKYFHQMNAAWNIVNLSIAGFGYHGVSRLDPNLGYTEALEKMRSFDKILLINAGLDLAYIGAGAWLWKRGINKSSDRQIGYGKSVILQGSFLLLFDTALYLIHNKNTQKILHLTEQLSFTGNGFILQF
ncbi:MAG: hypothetical protein ABJM22_00010 [Balneola sp.]